MYTNVSLIVSDVKNNDYEDISNYIIEKYAITPQIFSHNTPLENKEDTLYILFLSDDEIKQLLKNYIGTDLHFAILPTPTSPKTQKTYGIATDIFEAVDDAFNEDLLKKIDILQCNGTIIFNRAIIGDMHGMNRYSFNENSFFRKIQSFVHNLRHLKFKNYTLVINDEKTVESVALGITILEQAITNTKNKVDEALSVCDGKLSAFILAPSSLLSYLWYLSLMFFYQKFSVISLPDGLGYIRCEKLLISSPDPIELMIDENLICAKELEFIVQKKSLNLHLGRTLQEKMQEEPIKSATEDIINVKTLPEKELGDILIKGKLPFFRKASEEAFKNLFTGLRSSAKLSWVFIVLMILSTLLATTGLFQNSSPVVIGAMILAPLMAPIISFAMGLIRNDSSLINNSFKTLLIGITTAVLFSCLFTLMLPLKEITPQMATRLHPNLLDLMVAIFSGIAGAYATSKEEIAKSLAGVAIAVALVPPLSVTGIGFGMLDVDIIYGSFLLFLTNFVGITLSAALTFIVLGYAPIHRATKAIIYMSIMLLFVSIPLAYSFINLVKKNEYYTQLKPLKELTIDKNHLELQILNIGNVDAKKVTIEMNVLSSHVISNEELHQLKDILEHTINKNIILKANTEVIIK